MKAQSSSLEAKNNSKKVAVKLQTELLTLQALNNIVAAVEIESGKS